jgi:hypothetical protein
MHVLMAALPVRSGARSFLAEIISEEFAAVLILVAIQAKIFPVGAVRRIVPGIAVLVVHREQLPVFMVKFSPTFGADHPVYLEGALPVVAFRFHMSTSS